MLSTAVAKEIQKNLSGLKSVGELGTYAGEILDFVRRKDGIRYAEKRLNDYIESAKKSVSRLPASQSRDYLEGMTEYVAKRRI